MRALLAAVRACTVASLFPSIAFGAHGAPAQDAARPQAQLCVFLDCENCYRDYLQAEVVFVDYVRDRKEADVHVLITSIETAAADGSTPSPSRATGRCRASTTPSAP